MEERLTKLESNMKSVNIKVDILTENIFKGNKIEHFTHLRRVKSRENKLEGDLIDLGGKKKKKKKMRSKKLKKLKKRSKRSKRSRRTNSKRSK
jgi:hypothetical protein